MRSREVNAVFVVLAMFLTSCANSYQTYSGNPVPNNAVAILRQPGNGSAMVISIDGKRLPGGRTYAGIGYNKWELLPGTHRVEVNLRGFHDEFRTNNSQFVTFTAEGGRVYDVSYNATVVSRSGNFLLGVTEAGHWKPAIIPQHRVTDADRVKAKRL